MSAFIRYNDKIDYGFLLTNFCRSIPGCIMMIDLIVSCEKYEQACRVFRNKLISIPHTDTFLIYHSNWDRKLIRLLGYPLGFKLLVVTFSSILSNFVILLQYELTLSVVKLEPNEFE